MDNGIELTLYDSDCGCRAITYDVDAEGQIRVVGITRMDSRQSDDPPCPYCGEIECETHDDDDEIMMGQSEHHYLCDMFLEETMFNDFKAKSWSDDKDTDDLQKAVDEYWAEEDVPF